MQKRGLFFRVAEGWLRVENLLFTFWFLFWTLNGLDKFFNGVPKQDATWGKYTQGWFGVNRDEKFIHYFDRLHLPDSLALGVLYTFTCWKSFWVWRSLPCSSRAHQRSSIALVSK